MISTIAAWRRVLICSTAIVTASSAFQGIHFLQRLSCHQQQQATARRPITGTVQDAATTASSNKLYGSLSSLGGAAINIAENAPRDVAPLTEWATNYGAQTSPAFQLMISVDDSNRLNNDVYAAANQDLPAESPILYIPQDLILTGSKARQEFGGDDASPLYEAEQILVNSAAGDGDDDPRISQFYLFLKILKEYELGVQSPWYTWLNSLPRYYSNGASMTDFCFGCLPPYAAELALGEKKKMETFVQALNMGVPFISMESKGNADLTKWAFAVVHTRYMTMPDGEDCGIVPMADFFNHGGVNTDVYITYDEQGSCYAYSTCDISAGQSLRICYGDPTNPSNLLARYGFLDESSPATFCKIIVHNPSQELIDMGYDPSRMLFYKDGSISQEVWDVLLYQELAKNPEEQQELYQAHMSGNEDLKQSYHNQYFPQTLATLQKHVDYLVNELEELSENSWRRTFRKGDERHPRLPLLMGHNDFVRGTFEVVQQNLDAMSLSS